MPSRLVVNTRCLAGRQAGVQRYTGLMLKHWPAAVVCLRPKRNPQGLAGHWWEQVRLPRLIGNGDWLWSPANIGPLSVHRQVVTLHDASVLDHPEWFDRRFAAWYRFVLPRLGKRVAAILTDSAFSKQRLLSHLAVPPAKIHVVPIGVEPGVLNESQEKTACLKEQYRIKKPFVLFIGTLEPRKNLGRLLKAWELLEPKQIDLLIGGAPGHVFRNAGCESLPRNCRSLGWIDDNDLPWFYSNAMALVYPSLYEGFGLPPLEAMACGCPVVVSNAASLPEVCADAAVYCDPYSVEDIAAKIGSVLNMRPAERATRVERGKERARLFTWEKCAAQTWRVLQEAMTEPQAATES